MNRILRFLALVGFLAVIFGGIVYSLLFIVSGGDVTTYVRTAYLRVLLTSQQEALDTPAGTDDADVIFVVETGDTSTQIAQKLLAENLITNDELFLNYVIAEGIDRRLEAGTYFLTQQQTIPEIANMLTDSRNSSVLFRVIEGWRLEEVAFSIDSNPRLQFTGDEFLATVQAGNAIDPIFAERHGIPVGASLEGFLYPDTYQLPADVTAIELRDRLLLEFDRQITEEMLAQAELLKLSIRDVVTLASIVEREAVWEDEEPLIASVYLNRLDVGMRLDADPTVQYALGDSRGTWWARITQADYQGVDSPFNTYRNFGLPPSPIANPSISAIEAVLNAEQTNFVFFRAKCDESGYHEFAINYEQHLNNACS